MWAAGLVHRDGEVAYGTPEWKQWLTDKRAGKNPPLRLTHRKRALATLENIPRGGVEQSPTGAGILPPATSKDGPDPLT